MALLRDADPAGVVLNLGHRDVDHHCKAKGGTIALEKK